MVTISDGLGVVASYAYDAFEQRISKTAGGVAVHYIHDQYGRLLAEHDGASGAALREYVWLGRLPVAMIDNASETPTLYYIHADQVAQPQKMTDASGAVVWDRVATPFGVEASLMGSLTQGLRFPGQTNDPETSLNQNWHREYAPELGRYAQSDPIGLMGGVNTYAYVKGNPLRFVDPTGQIIPLALAPAAPYIIAGGAAAIAAGATLFHNRDEIAEDFEELFKSLAATANDNTPKGFCTLERELDPNPTDTCTNKKCQYRCRDGYTFTTEQAARNFPC